MNRREFLEALLASAAVTAAGLYVPKRFYSFAPPKRPLVYAVFEDVRLRELGDSKGGWLVPPEIVDEVIRILDLERAGRNRTALSELVTRRSVTLLRAPA